jgi:hypothetical protein
MAVDLRKSLEGELQLELSATIAFDFPSTNRLADQLNQLLAGASGSHGFDTVSAAADEKKGDNDPDLAPDDPDTAESAIGASLVRLEALVNRGNASNDSV